MNGGRGWWGMGSGWGRGLAVVGLLAAMAGGVAAQGRVDTDPLDAWIVTRYRSAHFLADSAAVLASLAPNGPLPRIESVQSGRTSDTLLAVHFSARNSEPMMPIPSRARLVGTNGTIVPVTVRVVQRRLFRAPRVPDANPVVEAQWRYGWAYLAVLPREDGRPAARYRGWMLLPTPSSSSF